MNALIKKPMLVLWTMAVICALLALIPTYPYVRLIPAGLAAIFAVYGLLSVPKWKQKRSTKCLRVTFSVLLTVFFLVVGITGLLVICQGAAQPECECQYVVVLGARAENDGPGVTLNERIRRAYDYLTENPNAIAVVSGGKGEDEPISEAQCMFNALTAMGIDENRIWLEDQAASTWENLKFSLDLIEEKTGRRPDAVGAVSSEFHLFRVQVYARDCGVSVAGIPAKTENPVRWLHYFVREVAGVWHYLILGGLYD